MSQFETLGRTRWR